MTISRKLIALFLALVMVALPLVACEKPEPDEPTSGTSAASDLPSGGEDLPDIPEDLKFEGTPIRFFINAGDSNATSDESLQLRSIMIDEEADMAYGINKAVVTRNQTVEDRLGVKIEVAATCGMQEAVADLQPILLGGSDEYDVISGYQYFDLGIALGETAGTLLNYNKIADEDMYIDPTKPYWDTDCFNELAYKGAAYWITGDLSQNWVSTMFVTFVNANLWKQYEEAIKSLTGYTDIYELVYAGKWTLDLFIELSRQVYVDVNHNDKVDHEDIVGFAAYQPCLDNSFVDGLAAGSHITYSTKVDGVPQLDFFNDHSVLFADKLSQLFNESSAGIFLEDDRWLMEYFAEGNILLCVTGLNNSEQYLADMKDDFYVVPAPKLNEEQDSYYTQIYDSVSQYAIPTSCTHVPATTATLELLGYYSKKLVTPEYYDIALKERYTRDEKAAAMIDFIHDTVYSDFCVLWSEKLGGTTWFFRQNTSKRFASLAKQKQKQWTNTLAKLLTSLEDSTYIEN